MTTLVIAVFDDQDKAAAVSSLLFIHLQKTDPRWLVDLLTPQSTAVFQVDLAHQDDHRLAELLRRVEESRPS